MTNVCYVILSCRCSYVYFIPTIDTIEIVSRSLKILKKKIRTYSRTFLKLKLSFSVYLQKWIFFRYLDLSLQLRSHKSYIIVTFGGIHSYEARISLLVCKNLCTYASVALLLNFRFSKTNVAATRFPEAQAPRKRVRGSRQDF